MTRCLRSFAGRATLLWQCWSLSWLRSDILTPLAALGVPFDIDDTKGPLIEDTVRTMEEVRRKASVQQPKHGACP